MRTAFRPLLGLALLAGLAFSINIQADDKAAKLDDDLLAKLKADLGDGPKLQEFGSLIKGAKSYGTDATGKPSLFVMHQKDEHLFVELTPFQFEKPFIFAAAVAKGAGLGGTTLIGDESWLLYFKKMGDKVFLIRKNNRFTAKPGSPAARATDTTYSDSVLAALPIKSNNPLRASVVVDLGEVLLTDFAQLNLGHLDRSRTAWHKIKAFPKNVELEVAATFIGKPSNPLLAMLGMSGGDDVIDSRGISVILHYSFIDLPDGGYQPRVADDRVGHFISVVKDFTSHDGKDSAFVRYVNRWRLERSDGSTWKEGGKLVPPKKKIVFWIENSVPDEYRAAVREGILEWNKAFEKIGFRDAIEVRQQEGEDFEPEDITYSTFRWVTNEQAFAIGPSRANPLTGEIIDADILFDASMVRYQRGEFRIYRDDKGQFFEPASVMQAARRGWMLPIDPLARHRQDGGWDTRAAVPQGDDDLMLRAKLHSLKFGYCQCAAHKTNELGLAMMHLAAQAGLKDGSIIPDELIQQAIKETVMHEVGHTLGLRHNFKASTMLPADKLHDLNVTRKQGLVGSVMDYNPANIASKGTKQGDYFTSTIGPYDYWAIEYAYTPNADDGNLAKIASRSAEPNLIYGTDEDLMASSDPLVNQWDMGSDPLKFATDRIALSKEILPKLAEIIVEKGEGYQRARLAFMRLLGQYGDAAFIASKYVGGEAMHRDHKGDANARDPFVPVAGAKQREALKFLADNILTDTPFDFPPELLRKLAADRWLHWGNPGAMRSVDLPLNERIAAIHRVVMFELFDPSTLSRLQNIATKAGKEDKPLGIAEVYRTVSDACFTNSKKSTIIQRNLQRAYISELTSQIVGAKSRRVPADARSLAKYHLKEILVKITDAEKDAADETVKAFLLETKEQIGKVLAAQVTVTE